MEDEEVTHHERLFLKAFHEDLARRHGVTKVLEWRLSKATERRYLELRAKLNEIGEDTPEGAGLVEAIRSLPGFPIEAGPDTFTRRILTDVQH